MPLAYYECELTNRQLPQLIAKGRFFCNQIAYSLFIFQNPNSILWLQKNRPFVIKLSESLRPRPPLATALLKANGGGAIGLGHVIPVHYMPGISLPARELFFVWVRVNGFPVCGFVLL